MSDSKTPVVFLHGVGLNKKMWDPLLEKLRVDSDREYIALDLPGHGSAPLLTEPQTLNSLAEKVVPQLPEKRVHLVGFSLGALIAQNIARFHPDRIASLTSVNSVCKRTAEESAAVQKRLETAGDNFAEGVGIAIERWFPAASTRVPAATIEQTRRSMLENNLESYLHAYAVFAGGDREIAPELQNITAPSLAITGELDPGSTPDMSVRLADSIPDCRVIIVPGARHMLPVEDPLAFTKALTDFIDEVEGKEND